MSLIFYLNNIVSKPPSNWKEIEIEVSFENDSPSGSLSLNNFEFVGDNAIAINDYIADGLNGGIGITEGMPFRIDLSCETGVFNIFDGILDFSSEEAQFSCDIVRVPVKESGKIDFVNDTANSFRFEFLASLPSNEAGHISTSDYRNIQYGLSNIPDGLELALASISLFVIIRELAFAAKEVSDAAADLIEAIGSGSSPFTINVGAAKFASIVLKLAATGAYFFLVLIAAIVMIKQLVKSFISVVRNHKGMRVETLFTKAAERLGLTLNSTILQTAPYNKAVILPRKKEVGTLSGQQSKEVGYFDGTFADLIFKMNKVFNADVRIIGNELFYERKDFLEKQSGYKIRDVKRDFNGTNLNEIDANYFIEYALDGQDLHTFDNFKGNSYSVTLEQIVVGNKKNSLLKGLGNQDLAFSHADRKTKVKDVEKIIISVVNTLISILNIFPLVSIPTLTQPSVNILELQNDFIGVDRLFIEGEDGKIDANNKSFLSAEALYNNFHFIESALPQIGRPNGNQWIRFKDLEDELCCEDFLLLKDNNLAKDVNGTDAKIETLRYNPHENKATFSYRINKLYTKNLKERRIIDGKP